MLWSALILGLLGSWHCVAMCGPIAVMVPGSKGKNKWIAMGLYHLGKITSYVLIGAFFGLFTAFITSFKIQAVITISAGILFGIIAFAPAILNYIEKKGFKFFNSVIHFKNKLANSLNKNSAEYGLYIGFFNGFIPCGMVYMAAIAAMVQPSLIESSLYMVLFGLGTVPLLTLAMYTSGFLKRKLLMRSVSIRTAALVFISIFMIWKGISHLNTQIEQPKEGENFQICAY
ncbi:MAG: sulfite exporter TauE/SafE family protein [Crocinitomicaceae bacterium]|nr:sulfite exporter TauE/SafE family protein [Crocinitomicaceae bacterium]